VQQAGRPAPFVTTARAWDVVVSIDPSLDTEPDPETPCPADAADVIVPVERDELLVGRRDDRRDIKPEIPLADPGASRRHAKIVRNADGTLALLDLASTNGTRLNGEDMPAGGRKSLREGDTIVLGRWTRLTVRARTP
jgi:pSer/pThr/pTyr-binding forkhead associated (FHA) protein